MFCTHCGEECREGANFCMKCGTALDGNMPTEESDDDSKSTGITIIGLIGIVVFWLIMLFRGSYIEDSRISIIIGVIGVAITTIFVRKRL